MTLATAFLAAALVVPSLPPPEHDDCEVVTNCVFDASRNDAKVFSVRIELDAAPSNGVEVVFGRYDVVASGSLLGIKYKNKKSRDRHEPKSIPVGYERQVTMHSLDFEEFLLARGVTEEAIEILRGYCDRR